MSPKNAVLGSRLITSNRAVQTCSIKTILHPVFAESEVDAFTVSDDKQQSWAFDARRCCYCRRDDIVDSLYATSGSDDVDIACGMFGARRPAVTG